jgi:hypothetical protein
MLNTIILQYRDLEEVRIKGLGFDRIDYLYVTKEVKQDKKSFRTFKKYKRKGYINKIKTL